MDSNPSRTCTHHEGAPAIAICTQCGGDICAACHGSDLRGYCVCSACRQQLAPPTTPWEDPNADYSPSAFARTVADVVKSPRTFFNNVRFSGSWGPAVAFGLVCMGLGLLFSTTWQLVFFDQVAKQLSDYAHEMGTTLETVKVAMFVSIPFRMALGFLVHAGVLHGAIKLAGGRSTFKMSARIVGYASAAYVFLLIPPIGEFILGHFLAIIWLFNIEMGALRTYFRLGVWKSMAVVMGTLFTVLWFAF